MKNGLVLVVDELDKAPVEVTSVLRGLINGDPLSDGPFRRVGASEGQRHPDFRLIALANRPGFPFLGNDFFSTLGDLFSCHIVENPDFGSEMAMLRLYGPDVPQQVLDKLVRAFDALR